MSLFAAVFLRPSSSFAWNRIVIQSCLVQASDLQLDKAVVADTT